MYTHWKAYVFDSSTLVLWTRCRCTRIGRPMYLTPVHLYYGRGAGVHALEGLCVWVICELLCSNYLFDLCKNIRSQKRSGVHIKGCSDSSMIGLPLISVAMQVLIVPPASTLPVKYRRMQKEGCAQQFYTASICRNGSREQTILITAKPSQGWL